MTSGTFSDFFVPLPLVYIFMQPPLHPLLGYPPPPTLCRHHMYMAPCVKSPQICSRARSPDFFWGLGLVNHWGYPTSLSLSAGTKNLNLANGGFTRKGGNKKTRRRDAKSTKPRLSSSVRRATAAAILRKPREYGCVVVPQSFFSPSFLRLPFTNSSEVDPPPPSSSPNPQTPRCNNCQREPPELRMTATTTMHRTHSRFILLRLALSCHSALPWDRGDGDVLDETAITHSPLTLFGRATSLCERIHCDENAVTLTVNPVVTPRATNAN